jgi:hypothetical protein
MQKLEPSAESKKDAKRARAFSNQEEQRGSKRKLAGLRKTEQ